MQTHAPSHEPSIVAQLYHAHGNDPHAVRDELLELHCVTRAELVEWGETVAARHEAQLRLTLEEGAQLGIKPRELRRIRRHGAAFVRSLRARLTPTPAGLVERAMCTLRRAPGRVRRRQPAATSASATRGSPASPASPASPSPDAAPYDPKAVARRIVDEVFGAAS